VRRWKGGEGDEVGGERRRIPEVKEVVRGGVGGGERERRRRREERGERRGAYLSVLSVSSTLLVAVLTVAMIEVFELPPSASCRIVVSTWWDPTDI
jgi:hypothetical protein